MSLAQAFERIAKTLRSINIRFENKCEEIIAEIQAKRLRAERESREAIWLHRKCGGSIYGQAIISAPAGYYNAGAKGGMGRQRSWLQGKRETSMGTAEVEHEES